MSDSDTRVRIDTWLWAGAPDSAAACGPGQAGARAGRPSGTGDE